MSGSTTFYTHLPSEGLLRSPLAKIMSWLITLRSWGNISGILDPWFIEVVMNRITLSKTLKVKLEKNSWIFCSGEIFIITTMEVPAIPRKNGTNYLANNVQILIHSHLGITIGHNINTRGWISLLAITSHVRLDITIGHNINTRGWISLLAITSTHEAGYHYWP